MTPEQIDLARHALGLPTKRNVSYRNHFVTGEGSIDYPAWEAMVANGWAKRHGPRAIFGGDYCYVLTRNGAEMALIGKEKLSTEDFPVDHVSKMKAALGDGQASTL